MDWTSGLDLIFLSITGTDRCWTLDWKHDFWPILGGSLHAGFPYFIFCGRWLLVSLSSSLIRHVLGGAPRNYYVFPEEKAGV